MEYVEAVVTSIGVLKNIWSCIGACFNFKKILHKNMLNLRSKMEELSSREEDINTELRNANYLGGKKQKREVETWLKNVQHKKSEVQHIEQKVGRRRYFAPSRFLRLVKKNIQEVVELIEKGRFPEGLLLDVHQDQEGALATTPLVGQSMKERNLRKIWEYLWNDEIISIGVYGMGGIGKTTIVTHIHNRLLESPSTFDHVYWVTVSQESNIHKLQDGIAKVMKLDLSDEEDEKKRGAKLIKELEKRKKFVLVLDDMWKAFLPEEVGIPIRVNAGKLIVTTRSLEVCRGMDCQQIIKVDPLSMEEAWDLFMEKLGHETVLAPEVEETAKSIAKECAGLPLAIITTARSMKGVDDIHEWRNALNELRVPTKGLIDMESEVFKPLKFSYDRLNDEKLQQCFLYCALFPEDYKIKRKYLIVCWIAEGLVDEMKTRQAEFDRGHTLLNKLENACLLERTRDSDGEICVKMHDVIRDMALNITRANPQFIVKAGVQLMELPDEREWSENLERVSLMQNDIKGQLSCISPRCPRMCTLMLQSNPYIQVIPNSLFVYMQNLKVLDLSYLRMVKRLPNSISDLEKLRALLLNNCEELRYVPSLAKLTELRELDLRWTKIEELPHGMENLVNLKRLDLYHTKTACVFPTGVLRNLSRLQSLRLLLFDITDDVHVEEITSLRQLEVLAVPFYNLHVFNSYVKTQHWQRLSHYSLQPVSRHVLVSEKVRCREVYMSENNLLRRGEDPLVLPTNIQELNFFACHDLTSLSDISSSLKNARELERSWIFFCNGIEHLWSWSIPSLEEESEWSTNTTNSLLHSLRTLMLYSLRNLSVLFNFKGVGLRGVPPKCETFSNLKLFSVGDCPSLKYVFTHGLVQHHLRNLEVINVYDCYEMENIILVEEEEEEEKQEEIVAAKGEEKEVRGTDQRNHHYNNSIITCPKLQSLELEDLPKLKSIWRGTMVCHSLQRIEVKRCPMLKRLPLSLHLNDDAQTSPALLALRKISGEQDWLDLLEWDHPDAQSVFQPLFDTKEISRRGIDRADEIWRVDAERYEL